MADAVLVVAVLEVEDDNSDEDEDVNVDVEENVDEEVEDNKVDELLQVLVEVGDQVLVEDVDGGGDQVEVGGVYVDVGVSVVEVAPESKFQDPVRTPSSSEAKNWNRPSEKSRPPYGHPGHCVDAKT